MKKRILVLLAVLVLVLYGCGNDWDRDTYCKKLGVDCRPELDCNDLTGKVHPGADELCHDDVDSDCDGTTDDINVNGDSCSSAPNKILEFDFGSYDYINTIGVNDIRAQMSALRYGVNYKNTFYECRVFNRVELFDTDSPQDAQKYFNLFTYDGELIDYFGRKIYRETSDNFATFSWVSGTKYIKIKPASTCFAPNRLIYDHLLIRYLEKYPPI
ncbi:putative metal-binding motif-containing protein [Nanoarchaeota archaeon]